MRCKTVQSASSLAARMEMVLDVPPPMTETAATQNQACSQTDTVEAQTVTRSQTETVTQNQARSQTQTETQNHEAETLTRSKIENEDEPRVRSQAQTSLENMEVVLDVPDPNAHYQAQIHTHFQNRSQTSCPCQTELQAPYSFDIQNSENSPHVFILTTANFPSQFPTRVQLDTETETETHPQNLSHASYSDISAEVRERDNPCAEIR
jgi:hypothetical protein